MVAEFNFDYEDVFRPKLDRALEQVKKVLDTERAPQHPSDVHHSYQDKYLLAELGTRAALNSQLSAFAVIDPSWEEHLVRLRQWSEKRVITLRFESETTCVFLRTKERKVDSQTEHVTESAMSGRRTSKTVTTVTEHFWKLDVKWSVTAYAGSNPAGDFIRLGGGSGKHELKTTGSKPVAPLKETSILDPYETDASWLFRHVNADGAPTFDINRKEDSCWTPRRNRDVGDALKHFQGVGAWGAWVAQYLGQVFGQQTGHSYDLSCVRLADHVFSPVLSMFALDAKTETLVLSLADFTKFLAEEQRSFGELQEKVRRLLPAASKGELISAEDAIACNGFIRLDVISKHFSGIANALEEMLRKQLIAAIGKHVTPSDFSEYMNFHHRRLYIEECRPRGFCFAVRRPDHCPEGVIEIADEDGKQIQTFSVHGEATSPMTFPLSAAAEISFYGKRHLHACVLHRFGGEVQAPLSLTARARQFSSYILLVGKIAAADAFDPQAALIVHNKDDVNIPLDLRTIPTPKEFKDAIGSLSPQQQAFCKAFRAMQLAGTVFGVLVIQIKPQLEKLLNLSPDALTKEVALTQELMELFIKYQFPSDLLCYDGPSEADPTVKLAAVKEHAAALRRLIEAAKEKELEEAKQKARIENPYLSETAEPMCGSMMSDDDDDDECGAALECMPMEECERSVSFAAAPMMEAKMMSFQAAPMMKNAAPGPSPASAPEAKQVAAPEKPPGDTQGRQDAGGGAGTGAGSGRASGAHMVDYTRIPKTLDQKFEALDEDAAVRPTVITPADTWIRQRQQGLLGKTETNFLGEEEKRTEKDKAFDLLDALTRSGALPVDDADLHVLIAATHCFEESLMDTVIQRNVNPIEKAERTSLIMSSTISQRPPADLILNEHLARVQGHSSRLFITQ